MKLSAFDEAVTASGDPLSILLPDSDHSGRTVRAIAPPVSSRTEATVVA